MAQKNTNFPLVPFDSQVFIDAFRIKWVYDSSVKCWKRVGTVPDVPIATEVQNGLLSRRFKQLLDSIPQKGGHFGILARPLLSVVPQNFPTALKDKVYSAVLNESGSIVFGRAPKKGVPYEKSIYEGHFLRFTKGLLRNRDFLIFTNDEDSIVVQGDASEACLDDEFIVFNPLEANEQGVIMGDIELVSDTLDITCVDNMGRPITVSADCRLDYKDNDGGAQAPGLDLKVSEKVLDSFCVELRTCKGSTGIGGLKGETGADGTGDGPTGEMGDPGQDAPDIAHKFTGVKFVESEDIYDSAVIGIELDADNGKLYALKAKMVVPDDETPATQVITSPINRTIDWTDDEFGYKLLKPNNDPIETKDPKDADVLIAAYPAGYEVQSSGLPNDIAKSRVTQFNSVTLSALLDRTIAHFRDRLETIGEDYDREIKAFIEEKDSKARIILAGLAQDLAECEWELPIEFCLGITPDDCKDSSDDSDGAGGGSTPAITPWPHPEDTPRFSVPPYTFDPPVPIPVPTPGTGPPTSVTPAPLPEPSPTPGPPPPPPSPTPGITVQSSGLITWAGSTKLPANAAFAARYKSGAVRSLGSSWIVSPNSTTSGEGLVLIPVKDGVLLSPKSFPAIQSYDPNDINSVEEAYRTGYYPGQLLGQEDRIVIGGDAAVDGIYVVVMMREPIAEGSIVFDFSIIFDPADPPPGVPVQTTNLISGGGAPGPTIEPPTITGIFPDTFVIGPPLPATIKGFNFQIGGALPTVELIGDAIGVMTAAATSAGATTVEIEITNLGVVPGTTFDLLLIFNDGTSAIGEGSINS